ncbi:radical SAM protein [Arthrobacter sp. UYEF20]|uniref:Rv1681 family radical SAM protein n=1 Tax=Arthrobacter sp. UYEF20 TaxID=1756363 RepID=UPI0033920574
MVVILDLMRMAGALAEGATGAVTISSAAEFDLVRRWCERTGNTLISTSPADAGAVLVRRGRLPDPAVTLGPDRLPGARLWLYTNFHCNLACDYCCVASSPRAERRELGVERIARLVRAGADWGVHEVCLTGGEPFLLPDIARIVTDCVRLLPTTLLTNGMLFRGPGLRSLRAMPREDFALQISLDSPTPEIHDGHRGAGSWARAVAGVGVALGEGFRVRVAATIASPHATDLAALHDFLDGLGIPRADQVIRPVAQEGAADTGVQFSRETLVPEVTVTADGVYWHPVAATDDRALVSTQIEPLGPALSEVYRLFAEQWAAAGAAARLFPCA